MAGKPQEPETKTLTMTVRLTASVKAKAEAGAKRESRSLANYIARLIDEDAAKHDKRR
jgi:predicted HicB family RNase H-like nuclease